MESAILFLVFIFGSIVGSFLNVLVFRYNTGRSSIKGRSSCLNCGKILNWQELFPVLSYLALRGKCRNCKAKISPQYPMVEIATGISFVAVFYHGINPSFHSSVFSFQKVSTICYLLFVWSLLIAITAYDLRHKIIPNSWVWIFIALSFVKIFSAGFPEFSVFLSGPILSLPFALIWLLSRGRAMGLGDAKLALGMGWMLGPTQGVSALLIAFWSGGLVGLYLLSLKKKEYGLKTEVPFAPFLVLGAFVAYFLNLDIVGLSAIIMSQ